MINDPLYWALVVVYIIAIVAWLVGAAMALR